jgi:hypothetical protein
VSDIRVRLKDGTERHFPHESRPGGGYENALRYEVGFVVVTDVWGKETSLPTADVVDVVVTPMRRVW